jgi:thiol-disulfide isomerase/thioredoxin
MNGVLKAMLLTKLKNLTLPLLAAGVLGVVSAAALCRNTDGRPDEKPAPAGAAAGPKAEGPPPAPAKRFENAPGWSWLVEDPRPRENWGTSFSMGDISDRGVSAIFDTDKDGALVVYLAYRQTKAALAYRPVAFDSGRKRYPLRQVQGGGHHDVRLTRFRLDPAVLTADKATYLGFECLPPEGQKVEAKDAARRAREAGVEVLPFPEVGRAYDFTLTATDGKKVRGRDLRSKVVLIDCWATWCTPCVAKMPRLKEFYRRHHKEGLEVVGVCFDQDARKAEGAIKRLGLPWAQVLVPAGEKERELWSSASALESLPRLLLIDRDGVLRAECGPEEIEEQIAKLMAHEPGERTKP